MAGMRSLIASAAFLLATSHFAAFGAVLESAKSISSSEGPSKHCSVFSSSLVNKPNVIVRREALLGRIFGNLKELETDPIGLQLRQEIKSLSSEASRSDQSPFSHSNTLGQFLELGLEHPFDQ